MNPEYRIVDYPDWMTAVIILSLLVLTLGKYFDQPRFVNFMVLPFNNKYLFLYNKKGKLLNWFHVFTSLFQLLNYALFLFLAIQLFFEWFSDDNVLTFFAILGVLILFHLLKIGLQMAKAKIFNTQKMVTELIFNKLSYFNHSSIFVFIANIFMVYIFNGSKTVVYATILAIIVINSIGLANLLKNYQKLFLAHILYFILYLCALEIAPLVILGSYLKA